MPSAPDRAGTGVAGATWATPVLRPRVALAPGDSLDVPTPLGRFFPLAPGGTYRVAASYGDGDLKAHAEGTVEVPGPPTTPR